MNAVVALRRFAGEAGHFGEALAGNFDAMFGTGVDGDGFGVDWAGLAVEHEASARLGAGVLGEQDDARVGALGG